MPSMPKKENMPHSNKSVLESLEEELNNELFSFEEKMPFLYGNASLKEVEVKYQKTIEQYLFWEANNIPMERRSLYLYGGVGSGKTHIAFAMLRELAIEAKNQNIISAKEAHSEEEMRIGIVRFRLNRLFYKLPQYVNVPSVLKEMKRDFDRDTYNKKVDIEKIKVSDFLILDDLGAEKTSDWSSEVLYEIINHRYSECLQTIYISNLSLDKLSENLDDRIVSRIAGMSQVIYLEHKDRRIS